MGTSWEIIDTNLLATNIKSGIHIFGVWPGTVTPWGPVLPSGNSFVSTISETTYLASPGPQSPAGFICSYATGTYVYWFLWWYKVQSGSYYNGYINAYKVNKTTGAVTIITSGNTMYALSSWGTPYNSFPAVANLNWTQLGFLFASSPYNQSCVPWTFYRGKIIFDFSNDTRGTYLYSQSLSMCGGYWPFLRGDYTYPGTDLFTNPQFNTIKGTSMNILARQFWSNPRYDQVYRVTA